MIKKILLGFTMLTLAFSVVVPTFNVMNVEANDIQIEEVDPCSSYVWVYKEVDGKKYMRLWDRMYCVYVTDWILVQE